ncbi:hypothetical protein BT69DRAFT_419783 [Atractiella rhizophila]|nr:hypothetical protein BT69DRAFT_419783 [Atractiella rhizophila]
MKTIDDYGIDRQLGCITGDGASNNTTAVEAIESQMLDRGIPFNAKERRMFCTPHVIHLAAMELLKVIGAFPEKEKEDEAKGSVAWQEEVTRKIKLGGGELPFEDNMDIDVQVGMVKETLAKLRYIVKHLRLTPQRRRGWFKVLEETLDGLGTLSNEQLKVLIVDCRTRWSSTHDMLTLCLRYREAIEKYVDQCGLERQKLWNAEWEVG